MKNEERGGEERMGKGKGGGEGRGIVNFIGLLFPKYVFIPLKQ